MVDSRFFILIYLSDSKVAPNLITLRLMANSATKIMCRVPAVVKREIHSVNFKYIQELCDFFLSYEEVASL